MYDYLLGGGHNFAIDREAAEQLIKLNPDIPMVSRTNRALLRRAVRFLVDQGITQFLDIGSGIPTSGNTHEVAQRVAPDSRIVYVDYDPIVLAHAHKLLRSTPGGACAYIYGDLRDPETILRKAADTLDFGRPAAIVLFGILHFFADAQLPYAIVARLVDALAPGGYLALSHLARDVDGDALTETFDRLNQQMSESVVLRTHDEVARFFDGLDLVDPGVVQLPQWRPDPDDTVPSRPLPMWCAVGRKQ